MRANRLPATVALTVLAMAGVSSCDSGDAPDPAAGNGLAGLSAAEIVAKAQAAGDRASSVRMTLRTALKDDHSAMTITAARDGDCSQEMTEGDPILDGARRSREWVHVLRKNGQVFLKTDRSQGNGPSANGWWTTSRTPQSDLLDSCGMAFSLIRQLDTMTVGDTHGQWLREGTTRIGGVPAVVLRYRAGDAVAELAAKPRKSTGMRIAVAAEGEPYLLRFESGPAAERTIVRLGDYNAPVTVTAPPAEEVRDFDGATLPN
ncbi:hypothetical protein [Kitasatospora sp. NPDC059673]|uniref:hypothetical protein n=1 Tax=Kitasatospora sp. NPDC059673 TaxID=3346901 RepID=UPI00367B051C